jgi:transposase
MRALPASPYTYAEWKELTVAFDYHVDVAGHYYSVPHALVGHRAWARYSAASVEVFYRGERVATHARSYQRGVHTTIADHMPKAHRAHAEWSPRRLIQWGESIGANTAAVVEHLLRSKPHPEQGYRACLGLLSLSREYGEKRLEAASALALRLASPTRKSVKSILESGRDLPRAQAELPSLDMPAHGNVRGPGYYH